MARLIDFTRVGDRRTTRQNGKVWLTGLETEQVIKSFSYVDINRWLIDLTLIENSLGDETTIWNVQSYIDWNVVI